MVGVFIFKNMKKRLELYKILYIIWFVARLNLNKKTTMNKIERLALIKQRAKAKPKLTESSAKFIEILKNEDVDLGEANAFGECLIANVDDIEAFNPNHSGLDDHDENDHNITIISPLMEKAGEKLSQRFLNRVETF